MSNENVRERDLVLAPNEFAFISDQTKGNINVYVGPYKTSLANTDKPVVFDESLKRFVISTLETATRTFVTAPEGWYIVLKNPAMDGKQPKFGTTNNLSDLNIGRKVNIPGPISFALWPGQMAKVIKGHHLRSNQYLVVRVYDEEEAQKNWANSVIKTKDGAEGEQLLSSQIEQLTIGKQIVIKGTMVSFYIPPTGIEVVRTEEGEYVREAVTLERMEYCILLDENGNKRYMRGPDVVFPEPTEEFIERNGSRKFKAIELNEISGIYIKVIAPYEEDGKSYKEGDELFITGKEQMIYYPRPEHALIKYGDRERHFSVAIPKGEGRYFLNRNTGVISLKKGPTMFLPDPRTEVLVRRILEPHKVKLWFPGNEEALQYNLMLKNMLQGEQQLFLEETKMTPSLAKSALMNVTAQLGAELKKEKAKESVVSDEFDRGTKYTQPRTITLDTKYEGAVSLNIWNGYAIQVVSKTGERKVLKGPVSYLIEYDEDLQTIELSTGTPKSDNNLYRTVYLKVLDNKVSDVITVQSSDFCDIHIELSYRVNFVGDESKWFNVENYVKLLTEHLRSKLRNVCKKKNVMDIYSNGNAIIRDSILGEQVEGKRPGLLFEENSMHVFDVEVLDISLDDKGIEKMLTEAQQDIMNQELSLTKSKRDLEFTTQKQNIDRAISILISETAKQKIDLKIQENAKEMELQLAKIKSDLENQQKKYEYEMEVQKLADEVNKRELERQKLRDDLTQEYNAREQELEVQFLEANVKAVVEKANAISPDLIAALQAFGDKALAEKMAESMAPMAILGGKSVVEVLASLLKGSKIEHVLSQIPTLDKDKE